MAVKLTIGFLGAGKMATALARGFINAEIVFLQDLIASDPHEPARRQFAADVGAQVTAVNAESEDSGYSNQTEAVVPNP